jgi:F0F1-type ATP synthase membrane subunit b/b'
MDNIITEYQKWKKQGEQLRAQAKQAMETRFHELLSEAAAIAQEYTRDFSASLKPPVNITAFRYKLPAGRKGKKAAKQPAPKPAELSAEKPAAPPNPKVIALQKRRAQIQKKIEAAKAAGKPTKNLDDRLYEVEDELRLAGETVGHA